MWVSEELENEDKPDVLTIDISDKGKQRHAEGRSIKEHKNTSTRRFQRNKKTWDIAASAENLRQRFGPKCERGLPPSAVSALDTSGNSTPNLPPICAFPFVLSRKIILIKKNRSTHINEATRRDTLLDRPGDRVPQAHRETDDNYTTNFTRKIG